MVFGLSLLSGFELNPQSAIRNPIDPQSEIQLNPKSYIRNPK
jgi:hypothetical protein